jgi:PEP-CTERM motif-containing protein
MVTTASVDVYNKNQTVIAPQTEYQNNSNLLPRPPFVSNPFTLTVNVIPGAVYEVVAEASGGGCISIVTEGVCATPPSRYTGTYTSEIDPYVTVDPSMVCDYDLTRGSGLSPPASSAVPEPSTWLMLLSGFGATFAAFGWRSSRGGNPTLFGARS